MTTRGWGDLEGETDRDNKARVRMAAKTIDDYLKLPYTIEVVHDVSDDHDGWFGRVLELPGCMTEADTLDELGCMIQEAIDAWIESALEDRQPVPEPRPASGPVGHAPN